MYIYLDESGDLGTKIKEGRSSRYFIICALVVFDDYTKNLIGKRFSKVIREKVSRNIKIQGAKGSKVDNKIKSFLYSKICNYEFSLFFIWVDKIKCGDLISNDRDKFYNDVALQLVSKISLQDPTNIRLIIDKSKNCFQIKRFDRLLNEKFNNNLFIEHKSCTSDPLLRLCDWFANGFGSKKENNQLDWYNVFRDKSYFEGEFKN